MRKQPHSNWWKEAFDLLYLETDARSVEDPAQTAREVDLYLKLGGWKKGEPLLDLCGGHGRHTLELLARGWGPLVLLDYSPALLLEAKKRARQRALHPIILRGEAQHLPLKDHAFAGVLLVGNSFGYSPRDKDNLTLLKQAHRVIQPKGRLVLEVANREFIEKGLPPTSRHQTPSGLTVERFRRLEPPLLICRERVIHSMKGSIKEHSYCLRLYYREEVEKMLKEVGFTKVKSHHLLSPHPPGEDRGTMEGRLLFVGWKA
ncbi:MAG TPA: class I SAM-dependent methyltransferase [Thermosulfidibacter takaii]|uniref:Class I SAM-dependent methyltransferase n=1 Tax=Thermosulfidibacter takaii TaxID=412593 RepID=A0A7C0U6U4_9BACT|nr:class I SAM-dependent methyltransferase [Thermosulfidibacter takaii]